MNTYCRLKQLWLLAVANDNQYVLDCSLTKIQDCIVNCAGQVQAVSMYLVVSEPGKSAASPLPITIVTNIKLLTPKRSVCTKCNSDVRIKVSETPYIRADAAFVKTYNFYLVDFDQHNAVHHQRPKWHHELPCRNRCHFRHFHHDCSITNTRKCLNMWAMSTQKQNPKYFKHWSNNTSARSRLISDVDNKWS